MPFGVVIPIGETIPEALKTAADLRASGIRTRIDTSKRKLKKLLANVSSRGIRYVILIGENEATVSKLRLKDMNEMSEVVVTVKEAKNLI